MAVLRHDDDPVVRQARIGLGWQQRALAAEGALRQAEALLAEVRPIIGNDELHGRVEAFLIRAHAS
jgi:hypothetical protein